MLEAVMENIVPSYVFRFLLPTTNNLRVKNKSSTSHIHRNQMAVLISRPQWSNVTSVNVQEMWMSQGGNV